MVPVRTLQDIESIERTPLSEQYSFRNTYEIFEAAAKSRGSETALHFLFEATAEEAPFSLTYAELFSQITRTANLFHRLGVNNGEVVAYLLPNLPQAHYVIWGGEAAGIVASVNPLLEGRQIGEILNAVGARVLVTLAPCQEFDIWEKVRPLLPQLPKLQTVLQVDLRQFRRSLRASAEPAEDHIGNIEVLDFDKELGAESCARLVSGRDIRPDDIAGYFHTGGTTGMPKIVPQTHANQVYTAWDVGQGLGLLHPGQVCLCGLPLFHANAVIISGLSTFFVGACLLLADVQGFRSRKLIRNFWQLVERYRVSYFSGVPTIYAALLDVPKGSADVSSLCYGFCGAAPMPPEVFRRFEQLTGVRILEGYGLTEATTVSVGNPPFGERRIGSIGIRHPYQQVKIGILGPEDEFLRDAASGEIGHLLIKGPNVFSGYLREQDNCKLWVGDGWLNTGDLGRVDEDGYFWLTGRAKDLIIRGGHNIDPQAVEDMLSKHPGVAVAAAVGQPDVYAGEVPVAYVSLRDGATTSAGELLDFARENVGERAAVPVRIEIVKQMPVTAVGKIFKPELRQRATQHALSEALAGAGIGAQVRVSAHPTLGTVAYVTLAEQQEHSRAREVLGRFAVRFEFNAHAARE